MPEDQVYHNVSAELLDAIALSCSVEGCQMEKHMDPNGKYTVVCTTPPAPAAGAETVKFVMAAPSPTKHNADLDLLHPVVRRKVQAVQKALDDEGIPMRLFEGFRTPQRQKYLYDQGRTTPGNKVTNAEPWESYHQYGLAADFVRFENGNWNWNTNTSQERAEWDRYHEIARDAGLEPLSWEKPHVQLTGWTLAQLMNGDYPDDGDTTWTENLAEAIAGWTGAGAPPPPKSSDKPAMPAPLAAVAAPSGSGTLDWHNMFDGDEWAYDKRGVHKRLSDGSTRIWRSAGAPITVQEVMSQLEPEIAAASAKYNVAPELIVMTIATEAGIYRNVGFTGPKTFRWEQGYTVGATGDPALDGKEKGDYSAGPMQVLSDTARWMNNQYGMGYNNDTDFTFFKNKPDPKTAHIGLYDVGTCIDVGTRYIRHNMSRTGDDPILVAAAFNAGGLYPSTSNHWRIRSHGNHLDRAAEWYGDACAVLYG